MTISGVQDLNACPGRLEGILNRSLSRGRSMEQNTSLSRGTFTSLSKVGAGPWGWWRRNKCYIAILSRGGGGGGGGVCCCHP